jgi:hypothetical protein
VAGMFFMVGLVSLMVAGVFRLLDMRRNCLVAMLMTAGLAVAFVVVECVR